MITEVALLDVRPGQDEEFEQAFAAARPLIETSPGCLSVRLERCLEHPGRYLLLVEWERLEDHTEGFRGGPVYERWSELLHRFYDPFPTVEHFQAVEQR